MATPLQKAIEFSQKKEYHQLSFTVNGEPVTLSAPSHWTILEVLRYTLNLTGSKQGCDKGDCGACTILVDGQPILGCITLAAYVDGRDVLTIEGLGVGGAVHPIQDAMDACGGSQCGFCNPGIMMSAMALLAERRKITRREAAEAISGNLCRCTGYTKIIDAIVLASEMMLERETEN
jgi:aerobic-type carbon monoxide dehydrogenase small subunit (CoxS/CutS family)